ncbi:hypothetical protein Lal_00011215 [Lupinus albus]|nr:hypothetical protein Lal_00011215 [Lupinus albus]
MEKKTCIAMVPSPGLSHLIPLVEFAKKLVEQHHNIYVTFLIPTLGSTSSSMIQILNNLPPNINFTILPQINTHQLPQNVHFVTKMSLTVKLSLPFLHEALKSLTCTTNLAALVFGMFSVDALEVAKQFNLLSYVFYATGAIFLSFSFSLPKIDDSVFTELTNTVNIPGCVVPYKVKDLPDPIPYERSSKSIVGRTKILSLVDGVIVNSFTDLEGDAIRALQEKRLNGKNALCVYPVGPIIQSKSTNNENQFECIEWLNTQPQKSVLYVSFGSGGTLSQDQINELAFGLELSNQKFLWVMRAPSNSSSSAYLTRQKENPLDYLPIGFLERTKAQGLVIPSWAPQIQVLSHGSIAAFLSHCGWNSTLESVVHGVPIIAWPLFAEQRMNAVTLTQVLKVAIRVKVDEESGIVKRDEIGKVIKRIMEGNEGFEICKRIKNLSDAASDALCENGSSYNVLSDLALKWQNI